MPSVREYFESELVGTFALENTLTIRGSPGGQHIPLRHYFDFESRARHVAIYLAAGIDVGSVMFSLAGNVSTMLQAKAGKVLINRVRTVGVTGQQLRVQHLDGDFVQLEFSADGMSTLSLNSLLFTGRLTVYSEADVPEATRVQLTTLLERQGIFPWFRDATFAMKQTASTKPFAFVSHDSRDKPDIVRPLVQALQGLMLPIWYDEYSLQVGDSLRSSIEEGLRTCPKCILVLTPSFLEKGGWTKREYDSIFTRELIEDSDLILPVWAGVSKEQVFAYSPVLADKLGLSWDLGVTEVANRLFRKLIEKPR